MSYGSDRESDAVIDTRTNSMYVPYYDRWIMKIEEEVWEKAMFGLQLNTVVELIFMSGLLVLWDVIDEDCCEAFLSYFLSFFYPFSTF